MGDENVQKIHISLITFITEVIATTNQTKLTYTDIVDVFFEEINRPQYPYTTIDYKVFTKESEQSQPWSVFVRKDSFVHFPPIEEKSVILTMKNGLIEYCSYSHPDGYRYKTIHNIAPKDSTQKDQKELNGLLVNSMCSFLNESAHWLTRYGEEAYSQKEIDAFDAFYEHIDNAPATAFGYIFTYSQNLSNPIPILQMLLQTKEINQVDDVQELTRKGNMYIQYTSGVNCENAKYYSDARQWYEMAAKQNYEKAKIALKRIEGKHDDIYIQFPTATQGGALYAVGLVITHVWNKNIDFVRAGSYASNGAVDNLIQVSNGDANVSMAISSNCFQSYYGLDLFTDHENKKLRVIAGLYPQFNQIIVSQKSGITKLQDVKGHPFAVANKGSAVEGECQNHFTAAGLNYPTDFQAEYIALGDASSRLINGTIDGAWVMEGFPMSSIIVACTNGCKLLTVDDDVIYELQKTFPW